LPLYLSIPIAVRLYISLAYYSAQKHPFIYASSIIYFLFNNTVIISFNAS
jgi:hypothetical protein